MSRILFVTLIAITLFSCKENSDSQCESDCYTDGIFVLNEGLFQNGNSSVTYYDPVTMTSEDEIFFTNNIVQIGDVLHSALRVNDNMYLVVSNSQKIIKVRSSSFKLLSTIQVPGSPRRMLAVSNSKAYVTDLFADIHIIDLNSGLVSGSIAQQGWTEELLMHNNFVYVCKQYFDARRSQLVKIDPTSDMIVDSLELRPGVGSIVKDANNMFWVLCAGDTAADDSSALMQIDPTSFSVINTLLVKDKVAFGGPGELFIDGNGQTLYYLNADLYHVDINATATSDVALIEADGRNFYDFSVDPSNGDIYVTDAIDFVQSGKVYRYDNNGTLIDELTVGVNPGEIVF
ncbi:MAG: hypothetical protein HKN92_09335 [Chitinophagales bacterium]|nr:hypothetical protein [Chitinophagales bacterium]